MKVCTSGEVIEYRRANETTVEATDEGQMDTDYGTFNYRIYRDDIQGCNHLAMFLGEIAREEPTLVRVHTRSEVLRDVVGVSSEDPKWTLRRALERIAEEGKGVALLLDTGERVDLGDSVRALDNSKPSKVNMSASGAYLQVGTGSQILRDLGVGKMRLLSSPMKFNAISGFDLEIDEYIPFEE